MFISDCPDCTQPAGYCRCVRTKPNELRPDILARIQRMVRARRLLPIWEKRSVSEFTDAEFEDFLTRPKYEMINTSDVVRLLTDLDNHQAGTLATVLAVHDYGQNLTVECHDTSGPDSIAHVPADMVAQTGTTASPDTDEKTPSSG